MGWVRSGSGRVVKSKLPVLAGLGVLAVTAALWLVVTAVPAAAHADLTATEPAAGAVLERSPTEIVLRFSAGVDPVEGGIRLVADTGDEVARFSIEDNLGSVLAVPLEQDLPAGGYVVAWRAVSADSHPIRGAFVFHVGSAKGPDTSALVSRLLSDQGGRAGPGALLTAGRWLSFAGVLGVVGVLLMVARGAVPSAERGRFGSRSGLAMVGAGVGVVGTLVMIGAQAASVGANWPDLVDPGAWWNVASTRSGAWWTVRLALLAATLGWVATRARGRGRAESIGPDGARAESRRSAGTAGAHPVAGHRRGDVPSVALRGGAAAAAAGLALVTALGGHGVSGRWMALGLAATVVHLLALGFWLVGLVLVLGSTRDGSGDGEPGTVAVAAAFSPWALGAVALVIASGAVNSVRQVGERSLLTSTDYGAVLVTKVVLVAALIGVAAMSRATLHRALGRPHRQTLEQAAALTVGATRSGSGAGKSGSGVTAPIAAGSTVDATTVDVSSAGTPPPTVAVARLRRTVAVEAVIFAVVLVAGALLVNIRPAYRERGGPATGSAAVGQRLAQVVLEPARAGPNALHVYLSSPGGALDRADPITVTATLAEADVGPIEIEVVPAGPNHVTNPAVALPLKGRWSFEVTARYGQQDVRFTIPLTVTA